jgi:hypothetical protein
VVASKPLILFEPKFVLLANYLLTGSSQELQPTPDAVGGFRYVEAEKIAGDDPATTKKWLEELASSGVLERRFVSKLVTCPKCGSSDTPIQYCCSYCRSIDIDKKLLFEHFACGVIEKEDNFKKGDQLECPRCGRQLGELGITHKAVGTWFLCRSCLKSFDRPQSFHVCRNCRNFFVVEDSVMTDVFAYRLSKDAEAQLKSGGVFLKPLKDVLENLGYDVAIAAVLRGASGTNHQFDLVGTRDDGPAKEVVAIDVVASDGFVEDSSVTTMFAKRYDANPSKSVLVVIPAIRESGKKLAALYKIVLIEAGNASEAVDKLRVNLSPRTSS